MKYAPSIAGAILGLLFITFGSNFFLKFIPMGDPPPADSLPGHFMAATFATGYMALVAVLQVAGGVLVAFPKTRNIGLLVLGPIIVNILCYHSFVLKGEGLFSPPVLLVSLLALFLLWSERRAFAGLVNRPV